MVVYFQYIILHQILGMGIVEEVFSQKRPNLGHFRIFGSLVYFHVTKDAWKKLEPIVELGIFLGYTDTPHNYQMHFATNWMTMVYKDIKFDEEKAIRCSLEREIQLHTIEEILAPKAEPQIDVEQPHAKD